MFAKVFPVTVVPAEAHPVDPETTTGWRAAIWPVVQRELREAARRPVNHRLRLLSGVVGTLLMAGIVIGSTAPVRFVGGWLLGGLHAMLLGLIFLIVPAFAADCIAREHREGTMALLFLTPLKASGIIAGKTLVQALRAATLWLAVLPLLAIPFLTGGVTWLDALSALSLEFCATILCLAAGMLASTLGRERNKAFLLAYFFAALFLFVFSQLFLMLLIVEWRGFAAWKSMGVGILVEVYRLFLVGAFGPDGLITWSSVVAMVPGLGGIWQQLCWGSPVATALIFFAICRFAATRLNRSWQDKAPSVRREKLRRRYCTPLFRRWSRRRAQRVLDFNPIGWLQEYSWKTRLGKWLLLGTFLVLGTAACTLPEDAQDFSFLLLLLFLAGLYVFVGVNGFLQEKRSGALEMLLVTPISPAKIIFGRTWGLWKLFLPACATLAIVYVTSMGVRFLQNNELIDALQGIMMLACAFLILPILATYSALRVKGLVQAALLTVAATLVPTAFALGVAGLFVDDATIRGRILPALLILSTSAFAFLVCRMLRHSLFRRIYSF
jgi:ABC-type transport system involved in multi-copper enzyme maturation permease subunit